MVSRTGTASGSVPAQASGPASTRSAAAPGRRAPLSDVLAAFGEGVHSLDEVAARVGLSRDTVEGAVEQLVRMGRIEARELAIGCPSSGCGGCAMGRSDGSAACGASGPAERRASGPALVTYELRHKA